MPPALCPNPWTIYFLRTLLHKSQMSEQLWITMLVSSVQWALYALLRLYLPMVPQGRKPKWSWDSPHVFSFSQGSLSCTTFSSVPDNSCPIYFTQLYSFWFWNVHGGEGKAITSYQLILYTFPYQYHMYWYGSPLSSFTFSSLKNYQYHLKKLNWQNSYRHLSVSVQLFVHGTLA